MSRTFEVVYNKLAAKKKKFDGTLKVNTVTRAATLYNEDGGVIDQDSTIRSIEKLQEGEEVSNSLQRQHGLPHRCRSTQ